jgi:hypothetical protein
MKHQDYLGLIPNQYVGKEIEADASVELTSDSEGKAYYLDTKDRLLDVNNWHHIAGIISAEFQVVDNAGQDIDRHVQKGDFIRIDIPGPGSKAGDGYDWVFVEVLLEQNNEDVETIGFRVRPSQNPLGDNSDTAHFYSKEGTSNFIVMREGKKIISWIVDRNIKPNDQPSSLLDKIRDSAVGIGALSMFSKAQWQALAKGFVNV